MIVASSNRDLLASKLGRIIPSPGLARRAGRISGYFPVVVPIPGSGWYEFPVLPKQVDLLTLDLTELLAMGDSLYAIFSGIFPENREIISEAARKAKKP